jgi:alpha-tubulin suppressor-like RCC1 family protein
VVKVACGNLHNLAVTDNGDVYTWGWGQNGALGHGNRRFQLFPVTVNRLKGEFITDIAGGGKASYVVTCSYRGSFTRTNVKY